jgi:hypothetical protein
LADSFLFFFLGFDATNVQSKVTPKNSKQKKVKIGRKEDSTRKRQKEKGDYETTTTTIIIMKDALGMF